MTGYEDARGSNGPLSISLVLCTIGREYETARCIDSIIAQNYQILEVVIVDQSGGTSIDRHAERLRACCRVEHLRTPRMGCSSARNLGARHASGEVIAFPDDDCWYPPGLLTEINDRLRFDPVLDGLTGVSVFADGSPGTGRFNSAACWVQRSNIWTTAISFTIFLRRRVLEEVGGFDEALGTGSKTSLQAGEETDYMVRVCDAGFHIWFDPQIKVGHPQSDVTSYNDAKLFHYALGMGYVARQHSLPARQTAALLVRPILGAGLFGLRGRFRVARFHAIVALGRAKGFFGAGGVNRKLGRTRRRRATAVKRIDVGNGPAKSGRVAMR